MNNKRAAASVDLVKMALYILKRIWLVAILAIVAFGFRYWQVAYRMPDTYTASGTMYVYNGNPNLVNYGYTSSSDLNSAVMLVDTYTVVVRSNKVLDPVVERLTPKYPGITAGFIAGSISMNSVSDTGVVRVSCRTSSPEMSRDICNEVLQVAPEQIKKVVGAGSVELIDSPELPARPDNRAAVSQALRWALLGAVAGAAILALIFLFNQKIESSKELTDNYNLPVLSSIKREKEESEDPGRFILNKHSPMDQVEGYAKLRMNLLYTLVNKDRHIVEVTSAISGEGKSTITASLGISLAMSGKKVLLVDADLRRACQRETFHYDRKLPGLSEILVGQAAWKDTLLSSGQEGMDIMPAGKLPPNPAELLGSQAMADLLTEMEKEYDLILLDAPPINIVSDPLALSNQVAGAIFVIRQGFSDHREVKKALTAAEMTGMTVLGFVFYGENIRSGGYYSYYSRKYYKNYYHKYDTRDREHAEEDSDRGHAEENTWTPARPGSRQGSRTELTDRRKNRKEEPKQ